MTRRITLTKRWTVAGAFALVLVASCDGSPTPGPVAPTPVAPVTPTPTPTPAPPASAGSTYIGVVREYGGGPLADVGITSSSSGSQRVYTDANGAFTFVGFVKTALLFQKSGYRWTTWPMRGAANDPTAGPIEVRMQRIYTLTEGASLTGTLHPDDPEYSVDFQNMFWDRDYFCRPCQYVSVSPALPGGSVIRLRWSGDVPLDLVGGEYYAERPITTMGTAGTSDLIVAFPPSQQLEVLLVGPGRRNGHAQPVSGSIDFTLDVAPLAR